jgi:hypothetical protein
MAGTTVVADSGMTGMAAGAVDLAWVMNPVVCLADLAWVMNPVACLADLAWAINLVAHLVASAEVDVAVV